MILSEMCCLLGYMFSRMEYVNNSKKIPAKTRRDVHELQLGLLNSGIRFHCNICNFVPHYVLKKSANSNLFAGVVHGFVVLFIPPNLIPI